MKTNNKRISLFLVIAIIFMLFSIVYFFVLYQKNKFDIDSQLYTYDLKNDRVEEAYLNYVKDFLEPAELKNFIETHYVPMSLLDENATGNDVLTLMKSIAYELMFQSIFDKSCTDFSNYPVTDNFKNKFKTNLIDFFHLYSAEDYNINCSLYMKDNSFTIDIYGIEGYSANLEPNYWNTYNFQYTLDANGNIDDVTKIDR